MFGLLKFKRQRNYDLVRLSLIDAGVDNHEKANASIKRTVDNGKNGTILLVLVIAILLILLPTLRTMLLFIGGILLSWVWASVYTGRLHIRRYITEEIDGKADH